jgi:hypothetical protein
MDRGKSVNSSGKDLESALEALFDAAEPDPGFVDQLGARLRAQPRPAVRLKDLLARFSSTGRTALWAAAALVLVLVLAWAIRSLVPVPARPVIQATLSATPVPSPAMTSTPTSMVAEQTEFVDATYGIRFQPPPGFVLAEQPLQEGTLLVIGLSLATDTNWPAGRPPVGLIVYEKPAGSAWWIGSASTPAISQELHDALAGIILRRPEPAEPG